MKRDKSASYQHEHKFLQDAMSYLEPLEKYGIKTLRINDAYHKGYSDLFVCVRGKFVILELKATNGVMSPHQRRFINEMHRAGATGGVCKCLQDIEEYIQEAWEDGEEH